MFTGNKYIQYAYISKRSEEGFDTLPLGQFRSQLRQAMQTSNAERKLNERQRQVSKLALKEKNVKGLLGQESRTLSVVSRKHLTREQMHAVTYFASFMKLEDESQFDQLDKMPMTVYMYQHINASFLRQAVLDQKITARAGYPPFSYENAVLQARPGQPFRPVAFGDSTCAMFAAFLRQKLIDAGQKTAGSFHYTAYLVHAFVLLHSLFNLWNELLHDTSEEATTAIEPNDRRFMREVQQVSFTQALNIVVYYSADRPVSKVRDVSHFSNPDMLRMMMTKNNRSTVKVQVVFGAPMSQEVYKRNVINKATSNKSTVIKHKPRTWLINLLGHPQNEARKMLDDSYSSLSTDATAGFDSATQADSSDQIYLITAYILLLNNAPGVEPYQRGKDLYAQNNTAIVASKAKKGILKGNYSYGPSYFMDQFYKFFSRHGKLQAAQQRFFQNACLIQPWHKLLLNNKNVPCLLECACVVLAEQYVLLMTDRQNRGIEEKHPLELLLESIFSMDLIYELVKKRTLNDGKKHMLSQVDKTLWQQFCNVVGFYTGSSGQESSLFQSKQLSCVVSFIHSLAKLFYIPTRTSEQTCNNLLVPHVVMMDELLLAINYNMLAGQLLKQIEKDQEEVGGVINLLEWDMFNNDALQNNQFNMFYLLRTIEKVYRENCAENSIQLQRSFCIPSLVGQDILTQGQYSNNLVFVLMDNHVQVCEMISINKVIVAYVRYLLQIKKSNQSLYDRRRTAALLQSQQGSEASEMNSQYFYDEAEEEHPQVYFDEDVEDEEDAQSMVQSDPSQVLVKGPVKKIASLGVRKLKYLLDLIDFVYGRKSQFTEEQKNDRQIIEKMALQNNYFYQNIQRFYAVSPQHVEEARTYRKNKFQKFGMAGIDIETCTIPLNTEGDNEDVFKNCQQTYGFDPETVGNQVPWMVSIVGSLYSCIDKQMHFVDKVFTSSPYSIDTCIDQLIIYLFQEGFIYNEDDVNASKCPASYEQMLKSCTNLFYTFNGANFDNKFIFPRLQKFCNVKWIQGSHKSIKQFSTYNCVFADLAQFFVGQSLAAVSKAWLKDTQWECYIKRKLEDEIQPPLDRIQDMLLLYNWLHQMNGRVQSSDIEMHQIESTNDVRLISMFDSINEQPQFNFSSIDKMDISQFLELYTKAFNFVQYCRQDSCATYYSTKRFFDTLYDINIKNEMTYTNSDMYALMHSFDLPTNEDSVNIVGKNFHRSASIARSVRDMLRRGVTLFDYFSFVDGVTEETSDYECFKFTYYSFMQSSVPLGSAALCLDMAKDTFGVSLPSIPALHEIEKSSYAGGLTQQTMRDYVLGFSIDINSAYPTAYLQDLPVYAESLVLSGYLFQQYSDGKGVPRHNSANACAAMEHLYSIGDLYVNGDEEFTNDPEYKAYKDRVTDPANYDRIVNLCTNINTDTAQLCQDRDELCVLNVSENLQSKFDEFVSHHLYRIRRFKFNPKTTFMPCIPVKIFDTLYVTPMEYDREKDTFNKIHEYVNNMEMKHTHEERRNKREDIIDEIMRLNEESKFETEEFRRRYRKETDEYIDLWVWGVQLNQALKQGVEEIVVDKIVRYVGMPFLEDYCNVLYELKRTTKSPCKKILYKLLLNALYGKFAQKGYPAACYVLASELIHTYLDIYYKSGEDMSMSVQQASKLGGFAQYSIKYQDLEQKFNRTGILVRIASFITATARANLLQGGHQVSYFLSQYKDILKLEPHHVIAYMDTDSLYVILDALLIKDVHGFGPTLYKELKKRQVHELMTDDTTEAYKEYIVTDETMQKALKYACEVIKFIRENCMQVDQKFISNKNYSQFWEEYDPPSVKMIHPDRLGAFKIEKLIINFVALGQKLYTTYYMEDDMFEWSPEFFQNISNIRVDVKLKGVSRTVVATLGRNIIKRMIRGSHVEEDLKEQNVGSKRRQVVLASTVTPVLQTWSKEFVDGSMISNQRKIISESGYKVACLDTIMKLDGPKFKFWPNIKSLYNYYLCTRSDDMLFTSEIMKLTCILGDDSIDNSIRHRLEDERLNCPETIDRDYRVSNTRKCDKLAQKMYLSIRVNKKFKEINEKIQCVHYIQLKADQILKDRTEYQLESDMKHVEDFVEENEIDNMHNNVIRRNLLPMTMLSKDVFNGQQTGLNQTSTERLYYDTLYKLDLIGSNSTSRVTPIVKEQFEQTLDLMERMFFYVMMMSQMSKPDVTHCEYMEWAYELLDHGSYRFNTVDSDKSVSEVTVSSKKSKSSERYQNCKAQYLKRGHQKRHVNGLVAARAFNKTISKIIPFSNDLSKLSVYGQHYDNISQYFMFQYIVFVMNLMRQSFTSMDVQACQDQCYYQGKDASLRQYTIAAYSHSLKTRNISHHDTEEERLEEFNVMLKIIGDNVNPQTLQDITHARFKSNLRSILNFVSCNVMSSDDQMVNTFVKSFDFIANIISHRNSEGMTEANVVTFLDSQKNSINMNKTQAYFNADDIDETTSNHSFEVPGVDLAYAGSSSNESAKAKMLGPKAVAASSKNKGNYQQLMNSYKMSGYSLPVHYQLINQISMHFNRVLTKFHRIVFTSDMLIYVKGIIVKNRPKNDYNDFAPAMIMIAYIYALGLHKSTRETWFKTIFANPYACKHFVPIIKIDKDIDQETIVNMLDNNCFVECMFNILRLPAMTNFISKNICFSKKLELYKVNHIQQTCLIHLNACWHYMTNNYHVFRGDQTFPGMRMIESFDEIIVPSDFDKAKLGCNENECKSEYVLYIWQKVFKRYMNHAVIKTGRPSTLQKMGESIMSRLEQVKKSMLQDNEEITSVVSSKKTNDMKAIKINFDFTVVDQLQKNKDYVDIYVHNLENKKEMYREILMKQNRALQELDRLIVTGSYVEVNNIQDNEEMIIT